MSFKYAYRTNLITNVDAPLGFYSYGNHIVAVGDFSNNGFQDLFFAPSTFSDPTYVKSVVASNTSGQLTLTELPMEYEYIRNWVVADLNSDGIDDLVLADHGWELDQQTIKLGSTIKILLGSSNGLVAQPPDAFGADAYRGNGRFNHGIDAADFNQDGNVDLVVAANHVDLYENIGSSFEFVSPKKLSSEALAIEDGGTSNADPLAVGFVELNGGVAIVAAPYVNVTYNRHDGDPDTIRVLELDPVSGKYEVTQLIDRPQIGSAPAAWGATKVDSFDVNNDGLMDLIIGSETSYQGMTYESEWGAYVVSFFIQSSSGVFEESPNLAISNFGQGIRPYGKTFNLQDVNGDGYKDLTIETMGLEATMLKKSVYLNDRNGRFEGVASSEVSLDSGSFGAGWDYDKDWKAVSPVWLDVNNDSLVDLVLKNQVYRADSSQGDMGMFLDVFLNDGGSLDPNRLMLETRNLAFDLDGAAGQTAKILGAVFGAESVSNAQYVGIGLDLLDGGMSYTELAALAVSVAGKSSSTDVCNLLWENVIGSPATASDIAPFKAMLDSGQMSIGSLTALAADTTLNTNNIDLVGLSQTGLEFV